MSGLARWYYAIPHPWRYVVSWGLHGAVAALLVGLGMVLGVPAVFGWGVVGYYAGQEVTQHRFEGTTGTWAWVDRAGDLGVPLFVVWWLVG